MEQRLARGAAHIARRALRRTPSPLVLKPESLSIVSQDGNRRFASRASAKAYRNQGQSDFGEIPLQKSKQNAQGRSTGFHPNLQNLPSTVDTRDTPTRLQALFNQPSSSQKPATTNIPELISIWDSVLEKGEELSILDTYVYDIAMALSRVSPAAFKHGDNATAITDILLYCWSRSNQLSKRQRLSIDRGVQEESSKGRDDLRDLLGGLEPFQSNEGYFTRPQLSDIAQSLARAIVLATTTLQRAELEGLLQRLYRTLVLDRETSPGFLISKYVFAAWAVLRSSIGDQTLIPIRFVPPTHDSSLMALRHLCGEVIRDGSAFEHFIPDIKILEDECQRYDLSEPSAPAEIDATLAALRARKETKEAVELWIHVRDRYIDKPPDQADPPICAEHKAKYLTSFFRFFCRNPLSRNRRELLELIDCEKEVLVRMKRPYPRDIYYTLLDRKSRVDDVDLVVDPQEVQELNQKPTTTAKDPYQVHESLDAAWRLAGEDGVKDVKLYLMYMEGLAKLGDIDGLCRTWNEIVAAHRGPKTALVDNDAADVQAPGQEPLTRLLNHMISCALVIPSTGPRVAMDLFNQVIQPMSAIPCDLITFNIMLRHFARAGDPVAMFDLFPKAETLGFKPDVITYTTLMQGLFAAGELRMARNAFNTMIEQGIKPNERTMSLVVNELAKNGDRLGLNAAEGLIKEMRKQKLKISAATWTSLIGGYIHGGWVVEAWAAVARMEQTKAILNQVGYNMLLRAAGARTKHDAITRQTRIHQALSHPDGESRKPGENRSSPHSPRESVLMEVFDRMIEDRVEPNNDTYVIALNFLCRARLWGEADEVISIMKWRGFVPQKSALRSILAKVQARDGDPASRRGQKIERYGGR